jgi:hypothetical protein
LSKYIADHLSEAGLEPLKGKRDYAKVKEMLKQAGYAGEKTVLMVPTDYATLKDAFDAINAGTHTGVINIGVCGDTTETAPAVLNASGGGAAITAACRRACGRPVSVLAVAARHRAGAAPVSRARPVRGGSPHGGAPRRARRERES